MVTYCHIDDHLLVVEGLERFIAPLGLQLAGHAGRPREALALLERERPPLVIMDWGLPGGTGFVLANQARASGVEAKFVLFTGFPNPGMIRRAKQERFAGVISKSSEALEVRHAIEQVLAGADFTLDGISAGAASAPSLNAIQERVAYALFHGETMGAVAEEIGVSLSTIERVASVLRKQLGKTPGDFARESVRRGILGDEELRRFVHFP